MPHAEANAGGLLAAFRALPADTPRRAFAIVIAVCIVCSVLVSGAAVLLQPIQQRLRCLAELLGIHAGVGHLG